MPTFQIEQDGRRFKVQAGSMQDATEALKAHLESQGSAPMSVTGNNAVDKALEPITSYPETYSRMNRESRDRMSEGFSQMAHPGSQDRDRQFPNVAAHAPGAYDVGAGAINMGLGALEYVTSPINAAIHTVAGKPIEENTGLPAQYTDFAASLALPVPKRIPTLPKIGEATSAPRVAEGPFGVTLSEGQATRDLSAIQREQAAVRGQSGEPAQQHAQRFFDQQKGELAAARDDVAATLDPQSRQVIADSPQAAGEIVSQSMQRAATQRKAAVEQAYDTAKSYPGEVHADAFNGISAKIKTDLSRRADPVIIDDKLTPYASNALNEIERAGKLEIQNRADPLGPPKATKQTKTILSGPGYHIADDVEVPPNIVGVNLEGIDQIRKRLSSLRKDAYSSGNAADGRATQAVLDAFDDHIETAINSGMFQGDPRAVKAWNAARAAYADYRKTFTAGKNDPIGRVVEKILGNRENPGAIANDVADFMYGTAGTNPSSLNVGVVNRLKSTLGDRSPEWFGIKQGLFSRLVDAGEGVTEFGAGKIAQRLNKFLNSDGKEMANVLFSDAERSMLSKYAELMRSLEVPQAGANWSNTGMSVAKALEKIGSNTGATVGAMVGSALGHGVGLPLGLAEGVGGAAGAAIAKGAGMASNAMQARKIAKQMPVIGKVMTDYRNAAIAFEASPSARTVARLSVASRNLSSNLKDIGLNFSPDQLLRAVQGPGPSTAQPNE